MGGGVRELRTLICPSMSDMPNSGEACEEQGKVIDGPAGTTKNGEKARVLSRQTITLY